MARAMQRLAEGDEEIAITGTGRGDEIGRMANALAVFRSNAIENHRLAEAREQDRERADAARHAALVGMAEKIESETGKTRVRLVDAQSNGYRVAREYMTRLRSDDFARPQWIEAMAEAGNLTVGEFRDRFESLITGGKYGN